MSICVYLWLILLSACATKPTDMRTLVPAETLVYLETNDLAAALQPIVDSKPFAEVAKSKPDLTALKGVQVAVAVTGFETSEEKVNDEQSIGKVRPRFVAVADTHAWDYQAVKFAETRLNSFVQEMLGGGTKMGRSQRSQQTGGTYITWTATDGRLAHALILDAVIYFANDETAIDKCLAVKRGEADSILKTGKIQPAEPGTLARGYVSTNGVAQIAALASLYFASRASDEGEVQSAVADILPRLIRGTVTDIAWSTSQTSEGIDDKWQVRMPAEVAAVFEETFAIGEEIGIHSVLNNMLIAQLPSNPQSATRYNLNKPELAWRSVLLVAQKQLDPLEGKVLLEVGNVLLEPYGIRDPELFLSSIGGKHTPSKNIVTARLDPDNEETVVMTVAGTTAQATVQSLSPDLKPPEPIIEGNVNIWSTVDNEIQVAFDDCIKIGSKENLARLNGSRDGQLSDIRSDTLRKLATSRAPITTVGHDNVLALQLVTILAREGHGDTQAVSTYLTETRFTKTGIERKTTSDFGFIGQIIAQIAQD
ncbi:MAG: hypothetical protein KBD94_06625 [Pyrinomonadaceae bacterium]|nr:hypothetical protein [Pyrinomonadaceae bacterium]